MEQFEQLLTCAICLDRYRNPKLLPCQHSFCMEPCMDGLVDYVRRQVKCPECRAEHRIPYQVRGLFNPPGFLSNFFRRVKKRKEKKKFVERRRSEKKKKRKDVFKFVEGKKHQRWSRLWNNKTYKIKYKQDFQSNSRALPRLYSTTDPRTIPR